MKNVLNNALSPLADELINKRLIAKKDTVIVDHLAFSFPLSQLRHCHKAGFAGYSPKNQPYFPLPPKVENSDGKSLEQIEKHALFVKKQLSDFYFRTLKIFVDHVLGFTVSAPRDKGFHGYTNSLTMKSQTGVDVGFIGLGGQRDTVYIQISGLGCKNLFGYTDKFKLHHWLNTVLSISFLSRVDLASDDYDGIFDCDYADKAYRDGAFRTGKGGAMSVFKNASEYTYDNSFNKIFDVEMVTVGKRTSPIYWRIYNKKLEQQIINEKLNWYRSEVELKKWSVDCLLDVDATFAGINVFSQSMENTQGIRTKSMSPTKEACLELASRVRWFRHAAGRALGDVLELVGGDISKAFGLLLPDEILGDKLGIPPTYKKLINNALEC
jgi:phage replication initiation protein